VPDVRLDPRCHGLIEQGQAQRDGFVELVLKTERLELLNASVARPAMSRCLASARRPEKVLDGHPGAARDGLERSHRGPGLAGLDEEDGLSRKVRARQLGHAQPGGKSRLPDEGWIYIDAGKAPAWLVAAIADTGVYITPRVPTRCVKSRGRPSG